MKCLLHRWDFIAVQKQHNPKFVQRLLCKIDHVFRKWQTRTVYRRKAGLACVLMAYCVSKMENTLFSELIPWSVFWLPCRLLEKSYCLIEVSNKAVARQASKPHLHVCQFEEDGKWRQRSPQRVASPFPLLRLCCCCIHSQHTSFFKFCCCKYTYNYFHFKITLLYIMRHTQSVPSHIFTLIVNGADNHVH